MKPFKILSPTAILGYGYPLESFERGMQENPDLIAVDAGSTDPGPFYLGSGKPFTDRTCVKRDLLHMLRAGVTNGIPVVIGTAGGSGAAPHLAWCREIVEEIAREEQLSFRLGLIHADIPHDEVSKALDEGRIQSVRCGPELTPQLLQESVNIVGQMGIEPIIELLEQDCQVILCGRCYDPAVFAALPVMKGYDIALAIHLGKILECAAIAATPGSGSDCVLGILESDRFILQPLSEQRRFTRESVAAHTLYEKSDPCHLPGPGGALNLERCCFEELPHGRVAVSGSEHEPTPVYQIKLEGARVVGFRTVSIAGIRDPIMIESIDAILADVTKQVERTLEKDGISGTIHFHIYGRDAVMGAMEPQRDTTSHELGVLIEAVSPTEQESATLCSLTRSSLLHFGYPGRIATAGNLAFPFSPSDINAGKVYSFSLYHLMAVSDPNPFRSEIITL